MRRRRFKSPQMQATYDHFYERALRPGNWRSNTRTGDIARNYFIGYVGQPWRDARDSPAYAAYAAGVDVGRLHTETDERTPT